MTIRIFADRRSAQLSSMRSGRMGRQALLAGVSAMVVAIATSDSVSARPLNGGSGAMPATTNAATGSIAAAQEAAAAVRRSQDSLLRANQAIQALRVQQAAAAAVARSAASAVPNGLGIGALNPVTDPRLSAQDATGLKTWEGAALPTATIAGDGRVDVNIRQTQSNAILSWDSFNVGARTTLTFDQQGNSNWVALNRVVGNGAAPSRILGSIKADGTVLVINRNGIVFGGGAQINVGSLMASSLDVGPATMIPSGGSSAAATTIAQRNQTFLQYGLLGYADSKPGGDVSTFSALQGTTGQGAVKIEAGAAIATSRSDGLLLFMAPQVLNDGHLSAPKGQVVLAAGTGIELTRATGAADSANPNVRGVLVKAFDYLGASSPIFQGFYAWNKSNGLIEAAQGNITLTTAENGSRSVNVGGNVTQVLKPGGAITNDGVLSSSTSVSRNGSIIINGGDIRLSSGSVISIGADAGAETIPQDAASLANFKPSDIRIGSGSANIEMQSGALLSAPSANVTFGAASGATVSGQNNTTSVVTSSIFIDKGATIDIAGLTDVLVPASRNEIVIAPVKGNELRDAPLYRLGFLNGATIYLDPRLSGVRDDGVAWIGSPLIDAASYYALAGVGATELMTNGGNLTLGATTYNATTTAGVTGPVSGGAASSVVVKSGAVINMSGGWVHYEAGTVRTTRLISASGRIVNIGQANPSDIYVGIANGFVVDHERWGVKEFYTSIFDRNSRYESAYSEGRDAGSLTLKAAAAVLDASIHGDAYTGERQRANAKAGSGKPVVYGDKRAVQGAASELPVGGMLLVQMDSGGSNVAIGHDPAPLADRVLPPERLETFVLSDRTISDAGLSQVAVYSSGSITVAPNARVSLNPGGVFDAFAGRNIRIDGNISAPGGKVLLETYYGVGSIFRPIAASSGSFDITVAGDISVAGRWVNDFGQTEFDPLGSAWLNGGTISMYVASRIVKIDGPAGASDWGLVNYGSPGSTATATDISGSILIGSDARLNLAGGGRIDRAGKLTATAKGGNLSLRSDAAYFQISNDPNYDYGRFRVATTSSSTSLPAIVINPDRINARIVVDPRAIEAHGFGGGGSFTLVTPEVAFGDGMPTTGTLLPFDFFSSAGFANYNITSYKTDLNPSLFNNGKGGYDAVLATQTLTVAAGQTLLLTQSMLPSLLDANQMAALRALKTGGDLRSVLSPVIPTEAWDAKPVALNLGGLLELHVAPGGRILGAAGSSLTVPKLFNEGSIRLPGGTITQLLVLPSMYAGGFNNTPANDGAVHALSEIFSVGSDGLIDPNGLNAKGLKAPTGRVLTNQEVAGDQFNNFKRAIYLLGLLDADQGIVLAPGSVTDLSGTAISNPRATGPDRSPLVTGRIVGGGTVASPAGSQAGISLFYEQRGSIFAAAKVAGWRLPETIVAQPGSMLDLSGAAATFETLAGGSNMFVRGDRMDVPMWSDAGMLMAGNGAILGGADIRAMGGAAQANGGTLAMLDPLLAQHDPAVPALNVISADMIAHAGFDTLTAISSVGSLGNASVALRRGFILQGRSYNGLIGIAADADPLLPVMRSTGRLEIATPYIGITSAIDTITNPNVGIVGSGSIVLKAEQIDITGAVLFDRSVASAVLQVSGDIRLTGVQQWQRTYVPSFVPSAYTLQGALAVNGDLSFIAGQVYPSTGSSFVISSTAANGTISFARSGTETPPNPYSAGGNLAIYAANLRQGGIIRVPFGTLTLGGNAAYTKTVGSTVTTFAPATQNVTLLDGSITGVSAGGLIIPYGVTTDQKEWYFAPTSLEALSGPPVKVMQIAGASIAIKAGATVDLSGGGDVYAYEFIPGTGGSRDVLDRFNADQYSGNKGYQYADGRQVYAIVPGLAAPAALYDPLYSADYGNLYSASAAGRRVWLEAAPGLATGWHTLLPAKYAMLPGGMRVVEQSANSAMRSFAARTADGTILVSGHYGDAFANTSLADQKIFTVQTQDTFRQYSRIAITSGDAIARSLAASSSALTPRLAVDAARLVLNPVNALTIDATLSASAAAGGRGSQVDIGGRHFSIVSHLSDAPANGTIRITADSLTRMNAGSLLIGGIRTDNADGTTSLNITAQIILVANDAAHPLSAPEIVLAVDDQITGTAQSRITLMDGATLIATGTLADRRDGNYVIDGRVTSAVVNFNTRYFNPLVTAEGALVRVANGPERLVSRLKDAQTPVGPAAALVVGNIIAKGEVIGFDTSGTITLPGSAALQARSISLGAPKIAFTAGSAATGTVIITPQLQAVLAQGERLTLHAQSTIGFDDGAYRFDAINLDAQNIVALQGGQVSISAEHLGLGNSSGTTGTPTGGSGALQIAAQDITFGAGVSATSGFGSLRLAATNGVFGTGKGGGLDVGAAGFTIVTPYIGDRALTATGTEQATDFTLRSTGTLVITDAGLPHGQTKALAGIPGSSLSIDGGDIAVSGTHLRATAGTLALRATGSIALSNGALLETPGYEKTFGDSADSITRASPGGALTLMAQGSVGISLGNATLSVGGQGIGGTLTLSTPNGVTDLANAVLIGAGSNGGGVFALDTAGAVDLFALNNRVGTLGFTGGFDLRTRNGDIVLAAGQVLRSGAVTLTADGGHVVIGGSIDTSGVNGGDIALYGMRGVSLLASARLDASAAGYAADDTRQAKAGNVTLGTDFIPGTAVTQTDGSITGSSGTIRVAADARIDVAAKRPGERLVRILRNGTVYYQVASADQGGVVSLRAPVVGNTVDVKVESAASVVGARAVELEGFKRWDLAAVAASGLYSGVTNVGGTIGLDVAAGLDTAKADGTFTTVAGLNFLGDYGIGTVAKFTRDFDIAAVYADLGGLSALPTFRARPGVDLVHSGDIQLNSNWNLGAGSVNVTAALAAGVMRTDALTGRAYVVAGREGELLANYTTMTHRTGGRITGAAPAVNLRAGGHLRIKGSITDGFFQFRDQYDPTYQGALNGIASDMMLQLLGGDPYDPAFPYVDWLTYTTAANPFINFETRFFDSLNYNGEAIDQLVASGGGGGSGGGPVPYVPYNALGNSAAAQSSGPGGVGDALASAVVFPRLPDGRTAGSSTYRLIAGAALGSADPMRLSGTGIGSLSVDGPKPVNLVVNNASLPGRFLIELYNWSDFGQTGDTFVAGESDFADYLKNLFPNATDDTAISLPYATAIPAPLQAFISTTLAANPNAPIKLWQPQRPAWYPNYREVTMTVGLFSQFLAQNPNGFASGAGSSGGGTATIPLIRQTMIRTGDGSISMAAAADLDLRGSPAPVYLNRNGTIGSAPTLNAAGTSNQAQQLGGPAIYTAGHIADTTSRTLTDPVTGRAVSIDPATFLPAASVFAAPLRYDYGKTGQSQSSDLGVVLADAVLLEGGGDLRISAGRDVLGRRDRALQWTATGPRIAAAGSSDQPWRIGSIGDATFAAINPQLFREGLAVLGGGNLVIAAGRDVSDISTIVDTSMVTATALPDGSTSTRALLSFGGGNLMLDAGRDILGGRIDVASGTAKLDAGRHVADAVSIITGVKNETYYDTGNVQRIRYVYNLLADQLRLRVADATIGIAAGGSITLQGIAALGGSPLSAGNSTPAVRTAIDNIYGFYSPYSGLDLLSNGGITITNDGQVSGGQILFNDLLAVTSVEGKRDTAIYPGSLTVASIAGDVGLRAGGANVARTIVMAPSTHGQLQILAGGHIAPTNIAMLDSDPGQLPGLFSTYLNSDNKISGGIRFDFPVVYSTTSDYALGLLHNQIATHGGDPQPAYVFAGRDIGTAAQGLTLSVPKQARVSAGRDIVNMMFFGQNLDKADITRITAGRDITATTRLAQPQTSIIVEPFGYQSVFGAPLPALQGNMIMLGGPGDLFVESGRHLGPFLNSAVSLDYLPRVPNVFAAVTDLRTFGGGILSVGNQRNPYLAPEGADIHVMFGTGKGADFDGLREAYVKPGSDAHAFGGYGERLVQWMQQHAAAALQDRYGRDHVSADEAYAVFVMLPQLRQREFLVKDVYFNELASTADPKSPSYLKYSRGYAAVNTLFPSSLGYTANALEGGAGDNARIATGDLDLRLAAIETMFGGDVSILGPGGRVVAGSAVATSQQIARRAYEGGRLHAGGAPYSDVPTVMRSIPAGYEGVLTLRGGDIFSFANGDVLLNQSRVFTQQGGDIKMWSSNGDLNAGQGPKTSVNFPPIVAHSDQNAVVTVDVLGGVTGAGIAALKSTPDAPDADVYLIAPRGKVDAGDAGVRVSGNLSVAALVVINADNFKVGGAATGVPMVAAPNVSGLSAATNANTATQQTGVPGQGNANAVPSVIIVEVLGYGGGEPEAPQRDERERRRQQEDSRKQDPNSRIQIVGAGVDSEEEALQLADERAEQIGR